MGKKITTNQKLVVELVQHILDEIEDYPDSLFLRLYQTFGTALIRQYPRADGPAILEFSSSSEIYHSFQQGLDFLQSGANGVGMEEVKRKVDSYINKRSGKGLFLSWVKGKLEASEKTFRANSKQKY